MPWTAQDLIQIITAFSSLITVIGGTWIAVKQSGISKKVDEAKVAASVAATKVVENAEIRAAQMNDLKETLVAKVEEVKQVKNGH